MSIAKSSIIQPPCIFFIQTRSKPVNHWAYISISKVKKNHANYPPVTEITCRWSANICRTVAGKKRLDGTQHPWYLSEVKLTVASYAWFRSIAFIIYVSYLRWYKSGSENIINVKPKYEKSEIWVMMTMAFHIVTGEMVEQRVTDWLWNTCERCQLANTNGRFHKADRYEVC